MSNKNTFKSAERVREREFAFDEFVTQGTFELKPALRLPREFRVGVMYGYNNTGDKLN